MQRKYLTFVYRGAIITHTTEYEKKSLSVGVRKHYISIHMCDSLALNQACLFFSVSIKQLYLHLKCFGCEVTSFIVIQKLSASLVGKEGRCGIGKLKHMNNRRGSLFISMLENVSNGNEAKETFLR